MQYDSEWNNNHQTDGKTIDLTHKEWSVFGSYKSFSDPSELLSNRHETIYFTSWCQKGKKDQLCCLLKLFILILVVLSSCYCFYALLYYYSLELWDRLWTIQHTSRFKKKYALDMFTLSMENLRNVIMSLKWGSHEQKSGWSDCKL